MFGFTDSETPETARLLFLRSQEIGRRLMPLPLNEIATIVKRDFAPDRHYVSRDEVHMTYDDLPDFSFGITSWTDENTLTIFGGGKFDGFMLQRDANGDRLNIDVKKPISRRLGPKAKKLADFFQKNYGATNPRETVARLMGH
jgi:hypothetical protein